MIMFLTEIATTCVFNSDYYLNLTKFHICVAEKVMLKQLNPNNFSCRCNSAKAKLTYVGSFLEQQNDYFYEFS